uniref:HMG mating type protein n=1 Tax=Grosmannia aurea TaxID=95157 RepID=M4PKQ3_9PEZI|nr:HMG mating type protein [Grosmannia aurea]AGH03145.1 HMG mating type protein [Grosmannia aurea]
MDPVQFSAIFNISMNGSIVNTAIDPVILTQFWESLAIQLMPGRDVIGISGPTFRVLDDGGKQFIAHHFASAIGDTMVKYVIDGSGMHPDRYFLGRTSFFHPDNLISHAGELDVWIPSGYPLGSSNYSFNNGQTGTPVAQSNAQRTGRNGTVRIPRPPNAYILYRKDHHKAVKKSDPELSNNEISVILGRQWNAESDDVRMHYHTMAIEIKRQVERLHPDYRYNPRRSSEIRRRARGNHGVYNVDGTNSVPVEQNAGNTAGPITAPSIEFSMSPGSSASTGDEAET